MKVILLGNGNRKGVSEAVAVLRPEIERIAEIVAVDFYGKKNFSHVNADLAIVFGGDGSILRAAAQLGLNQIPVLAVQLGTLSFLSNIQSTELIELLERPDLKEMPVIEHLLLRCELYRRRSRKNPRLVPGTLESYCFALNEVWLQGDSMSRLTSLELYIDDELVTTYRGDGLLLATPVGSTAHNLSAGGPIVRKDIDAVIVAPVSPHTLSNRPLVDSPDHRYEIRVRQTAILIVDGVEIGRVEPGDSVCVTRAEQTFKTVAVPGYSYYRTLRNKLGWNGSFTEE